MRSFNEAVCCSADEFRKLKKLLIDEAYTPVGEWPSDDELKDFETLYIVILPSGTFQCCVSFEDMRCYVLGTPMRTKAYMKKYFPHVLQTVPINSSKGKVTLQPSHDEKLFFIPTPENRGLLFRAFAQKGLRWMENSCSTPKAKVVCVFNKSVYTLSPDSNLNGFVPATANAYIKKHLPQACARFYKNADPLTLAWTVYQNNKTLLDEIIDGDEATNAEAPFKKPTGLTFKSTTGATFLFDKVTERLYLDLLDPVTGILLPQFAEILSASDDSLLCRYDRLVYVAPRTPMVSHLRFVVNGKTYLLLSGITTESRCLRLGVESEDNSFVKLLSIPVTDLRDLITNPVTFLYE